MHAKFKYFILITTALCSLNQALGQEAHDYEKKASMMANKALARGFSEQFHEQFLSAIVKYNKRTEKLSRVLVNQNHKTLAQRVQNFVLPKFKLQKSHKALMQVGPHTISVSTYDLFKGQIQLNQSPLDMTEKLAPEHIREHLARHTNIKTSWVDLFIGKAHALNRDPFEIALFATIMAMQESFDEQWCLLSSCAQERARRNFDQVMKTVKKQAQICQNNPESKKMLHFGFKIVDYVEYDTGRYNFEETLKDAFNKHPVQNATCQDFVESLHAEEIEEKTSEIEAPGYISGLTSAKAYDHKAQNAKAFKSYIQNICRPYIELRNCLIQEEYSSVRRIFNETRRPWKRKPEKSYDVRPRDSKGSER